MARDLFSGELIHVGHCHGQIRATIALDQADEASVEWLRDHYGADIELRVSTTNDATTGI